MQWASAISVNPDLEQAASEAAAMMRHELGDAPDLVLAFVSPHHASRYDELPDLLAALFESCAVVGATGAGVIGDGVEIEGGPALALAAAVLPGVEVHPFHLLGAEAALLDGTAVWERRLGVPADDLRALIVLPDPYTCNAQAMIRRLDAALPATTLIGGLVSGGEGPGQTALWAEGQTFHEGVVGVALAGALQVDTIVAQGCRPIGEPLFVTQAHQNVIQSLDGLSPAEVVRTLYHGLDEHDQRLFLAGLFVGVVMHPDRAEYGAGDFLIRNVVGVDADTGAISVGALVQPNQVVQFHLHDANRSREDLREHLARYTSRHADSAPVAGALIFSCLGRGARLYGEPNHDSDALRASLGELPIAGFFGHGEIGPVGGPERTFLHGFTSAIALFRDIGC